MSVPDDDQNTRILIHEGGQSRSATIVAQSMDGRVYSKYDDSEVEVCLNLSSLNYQWLWYLSILGPYDVIGKHA